MSAARAMQQGGRTRPPDPAAQERFDLEYAVFLQMHEHRQSIDRLLTGASASR